MAHLTDPRYAPALRRLTPPPEYALVWRSTLAAAGLYAQLGATVGSAGTQQPGWHQEIHGREMLASHSCPGDLAGEVAAACNR